MGGRALLAAPALAGAPLFIAPDRSVEAAQVHDAPGSLCATNEVVIFHCAVGRKMLSVCGGRRPMPHAQYRFGTPGDIELAFPGPDQSGLSWAREAYSGGGALQIGFSNGGYDYAVYSRTVRTGFRGRNNPHFSDGIMVRRGGRLLANRSCTSEVRGDARPEEFMPEGRMTAWPD
ncbi:MAG TPA: hypothetical protein VEC11_08995 [Allosphingosinicella sp.]|nr:hypothetical protein [Allosphingosinicella sp.]